MARTYFCPNCLAKINQEQVRYRTRNGEETAQPVIVYDRGPAEWAKAIWTGDPRHIHQKDRAALAERFRQGIHGECPNGHVVPDDAFGVRSVAIGLVGEAAAGKSVFLASLLDLLERGRLMPYLDFRRPEAARRVIAERFGPFYRFGEAPAATTTAAPREAITVEGYKDGELQAYLSFFDTAGDYSDYADLGEHNRALFAADVMMFFITPEALHLPKSRPQRRPDQRQSWSDTHALIQVALEAAKHSKTLAHAAVILCKSDDIDPSSLNILKEARADLRYGDGLTLHRAFEVIEQDSAYIRRFMDSNDDGRVVARRIEETFTTVSYHLVSATGGPADPGTGRFVNPRPQRVLDPLLTSLVRTGMLDPNHGTQALR
ncbi:hypothetical protein GCM10009841_21870 [Microlunatus panaciterrae]|uniref:Intracellular protease/amidase n=1 Tax=Microlunatus panaciterrae TaxID=400768 RepID=A0ABS2RQ62_9ACTN|nr:hypothetical protein [Microlunatus panaciterrae]MBM7800742.1 putative intracellular protease/amidase [Microlunatus panaciterrae]